jgi:hypothetical protein
LECRSLWTKVSDTLRSHTLTDAPVVGSQPFCALNATALSLQLSPTFLPIVTSFSAPAGPANWYRNAAFARVSCCTRSYTTVRGRTVEETQRRAAERAEAVVDDGNNAGECGRGRGRAVDSKDVSFDIDLEIRALSRDLEACSVVSAATRGNLKHRASRQETRARCG